VEPDPETNGTDAKRFFPSRPGTINFEVWGMPAESYKDFLTYSKEVAGGKMAVAIMTLMELAQTYAHYAELKEKMNLLEGRIEKLETNGKEKPKPMTLSEKRAVAQTRGVEDGKIGEILG